MRCALALAGPAALPAFLPSPVHGQGRDCTIVQSGTTNVFNANTEQEMVFMGGGVRARFTCPGGTQIESDSVARFRAPGIIEFIGRVRYTDRDNILTAGFVRYMERERMAIAQQNVLLTDRVTGSEIRGPVMNYHQQTEERAESLVQIPSGRPSAVVVSIARADSTRRDTTLVDADGMDITGRSRFQGRGNVELRRAGQTGYGGNLFYDRDQGDLRIWVDARLEMEDTRLSGDTITGRSNELEELEEVTGTGNARLEASDVTIQAPLIRVFFTEGEVNRLVAVAGPRPAEADPDPTRQATALSQDFRLTADSIEALAPGRELERVTAVGRAFGERLTGDIADANVPAFAARDWMKGDTVIATFIAAAPAEPPADSAARDREVDVVIAVGVSERATSSYRVRDEENPDAAPGINYLLARRITVRMAAGTVATVDAQGEVQGLYLQPGRAASRPRPERLP